LEETATQIAALHATWITLGKDGPGPAKADGRGSTGGAGEQLSWARVSSPDSFRADAIAPPRKPFVERPPSVASSGSRTVAPGSAARIAPPAVRYRKRATTEPVSAAVLA